MVWCKKVESCLVKTSKLLYGMWSHLCKNGWCRKGWAKWGHILPSGYRYLSIKQEALELCVAQRVLIKWNVFFNLFYLKWSPISSLSLILSLYPPHCNETMQEVGSDHIRNEGSVTLLIDQGNNIIPNVSLSLQLREKNRWVVIQGIRSWYKYVAMKDILALVWLFHSVI